MVLSKHAKLPLLKHDKSKTRRFRGLGVRAFNRLVSIRVDRDHLKFLLNLIHRSEHEKKYSFMEKNKGYNTFICSKFERIKSTATKKKKKMVKETWIARQIVISIMSTPNVRALAQRGFVASQCEQND